MLQCVAGTLKCSSCHEQTSPTRAREAGQKLSLDDLTIGDCTDFGDTLNEAIAYCAANKCALEGYLSSGEGIIIIPDGLFEHGSGFRADDDVELMVLLSKDSRTEITNGTTPEQAAKRTRKPALQVCKFCGDWVNLDEEGNTYRDGTAAHEQCHDNAEFERENSSDMRD